MTRVARRTGKTLVALAAVLTLTAFGVGWSQLDASTQTQEQR